ncbi:MAG: YggT family protein [Limnochordales bacterium]|nr:YggT family protein [Limnochordales bacterium]
MNADLVAFLINLGASIVRIYELLIVARIVLSWFVRDWYHPVVRALDVMTEPYLRIFRSFLPPLGGLDFSPMVALLVLDQGWALIASLLWRLANGGY